LPDFPLTELDLKMPHLLFRQLDHSQQMEGLMMMHPGFEKRRIADLRMIY
jgi:hypothetical protein